MPGGRCRVTCCAVLVAGGLGRLGRLLRAAAPGGGRSGAPRRGRTALGVRRSSTAWRRASPSASSPSPASALPLASVVGAGASAPSAARPRRHSRHRSRRCGRVPRPSGRAPRPTRCDRGDTLWSIADDALGDGADWTSLAALNLGRDVGGGARFVDPDHLRAGWRLRLPAEARHPDDATGHTEHRAPPGSRRDHLPELIALGLGSLACAALARRAGGVAGSATGSRGDARLPAEPSEEAVDTATLLQRFAGVPALEAFEAANRLLGPGSGGPSAGPTVRASASRRPASRSTFADADPDEPPEGFVRLARTAPRGTWTTTPSSGQRPAPSPTCPSSSPSATTTRGPGSSRSEPGDVLPVLGEAAPALLAGRTGRRRVVGLVGPDPGDGRSRRPATPRRGRGRAVRGPARALLRRPALRSAGDGATRCAVITDGTGRRQ